MIMEDNFLLKKCASLFSFDRIIHQTTCPHTPQQNGIVEIKHKHILNIGRAIQFQAQFLKTY